MTYTELYEKGRTVNELINLNNVDLLKLAIREYNLSFTSLQGRLDFEVFFNGISVGYWFSYVGRGDKVREYIRDNYNSGGLSNNIND